MRRVAGGEITGFYQRDAQDGVTGDVDVEAYSWGRLTAGRRRENRIANWRRAGWTLLLPFALVNVALWARPNIPYDPDEKGQTAFAAWLVRVVGVGLTCTMLLAVSGVSMDVIAWQCLPSRCGGPGWVHDLLTLPFFTGGPRRVVAGAVIPLLVIGVFYWLSGSSFHYEAVAPGHTGAGPAAEQGLTRLEHPHFWRGTVQVRALRRLHTGAALDVVAHALAGCIWAAPNTPSWVTHVAVAASVIAIAGVAVSLAALSLPVVRIRGAQAPGPGTSLLLSFPVVTGGAALILAVVAAVNAKKKPPAPSPAFPSMPGLDGTIRVTYLLMFAALLALMVVSSRQAEKGGLLDRGPDSASWFGLASPVFAGAGWLVSLVYSVSLLFGASWFMGGPQGPGKAQFAVMIQWDAIGVLACALIAAGVGAVAVVHLSRLRAAEVAAVQEAVDQQNWHAYGRAADLGKARGLHRYIGYRALRQAGWLATCLLFVVAAGALIAVGRNIGFRKPQHHLGWDVLGFTAPDVPANWLLQVAAGLTTLILLALVYLGYTATKYPVVLRTLGAVWDIVTFWPRGAHPFGPPCYAEQAVPQLATRIEGRAEVPLVLAGHSQGSVICAATIAQLSPGRRERTFLLTFGTQLTRLYGRAFPAFFALEGRHRLATLLGGSADTPTPWADARWRSLRRDTDFLGWRIAAATETQESATNPAPDDLGAIVDVSVVDPIGLNLTTSHGLVPTPGEITDPPIHAHSDYPLTPEYLGVRNYAASCVASPVSVPTSPPATAVSGTGHPVTAKPGPGPGRSVKPARTLVIASVVLIALSLVEFTNHIGAVSGARRATPSGNVKGSLGTSPPVKQASPIPATSLGTISALPSIGVPNSEGLGGMALSPDGKELYVPDIEKRSVVVIDTAAPQRQHSWSFKLRPRSVTLSPDGSRAFVLFYQDGCHPEENDVVSCPARMLSAINVNTGPPAALRSVGENAVSVTVSDNKLYIPNHGVKRHLIDVYDMSVHFQYHIKVDSNPHSIDFSHSGVGYAAIHESQIIQIVKPGSHKGGTKIELPPGAGPHFVAVSPDQRELWVADYKGNRVEVIQINTHGSSHIRKLRVGTNPQMIAFARDMRHAYVVNYGSNDVSVFSTDDPKDDRSPVSVDEGSASIVVSLDGRLAYVSSLTSGKVSVLRLAQ